jgi:Tol biopolymer transport system component
VYFVTDVGGVIALYRAPADGSGSIEPVSAMSRPVDEGIWSRDGAWLFMRAGSGGGRDIFAVKGGASESPTPIVTSDADEYSPAPSLDGKWLAYGSNVGGRDEVYVRGFPDASAGQVQISVDGGTEPVWAHSGRELFYRDRDAMLVSATLDLTGTPRVTARQRLFSTSRFFNDARNRGYSVAPGDRAFYFVQSVQAAPARDALIVVLNWAEQLKKVR